MKLWIDQTQVAKHNLKDADLKDCSYDTLRLGYWIEKDSPTAVWLTLKGLTLRQPPHLWILNRPRKYKR